MPQEEIIKTHEFLKEKSESWDVPLVQLCLVAAVARSNAFEYMRQHLDKDSYTKEEILNILK